MSENAFPDTDKPLTEAEKLNRASDWSDYRSDYGVSGFDSIRQAEHKAFCAGWDAAHRAGLRRLNARPIVQFNSKEPLA